MFAMVLAIGLLVDDAIVVVENITRLVLDENLTVKEAASVSLKQIAPALIGVGLVIAAVFTPMGFFPGASGNIYRQFSVTIVSAMLLSVVAAIVITPSLCARFLKVSKGTSDKKTFLDYFENGFLKLRELYLVVSTFFLNHLKTAFALLILITISCAALFLTIPTSFLPVEDQSVLSARIILPAGTVQEKTKKLALEIEDYFLLEEKEYVEGVMLTLGSGGGSASGQSTASLSIRLKPWEERESQEASAQAILERAKNRFSNYPNAKINFFLPASVRGLGSSAGFSVNVQNVSGHSHEQFLADVIEIVERANNSVRLSNVRYEVQDDAPELMINIDDLKAGQYGLSPQTINTNLEIAWGGDYVNDFIDRGRIKSVYVQSAPEFRSLPQNLDDLYLRNSQGEMAAAFNKAGFNCIDVHMSDILSGKVSLKDFKGFAACGGFSYGDVLGAGEGWAKSVLFNSKAREEFEAFFNRQDTFALGVCNGCQMMSTLRDLIPGAALWPRFVTNRSERFEARFVEVAIQKSPSIFFDGMEDSMMPIVVSHGEGRAEFKNEEHLKALEEKGLVAMRYIDHQGEIAMRYPLNPNGSPNGITSVTTEDGRFTILMPHPERVQRAVACSWHPDEWQEDSPWVRIFRNARKFVG